MLLCIQSINNDLDYFCVSRVLVRAGWCEVGEKVLGGRDWLGGVRVMERVFGARDGIVGVRSGTRFGGSGWAQWCGLK